METLTTRHESVSECFGDSVVTLPRPSLFRSRDVCPLHSAVSFWWGDHTLDLSCLCWASHAHVGLWMLPDLSRCPLL